MNDFRYFPGKLVDNHPAQITPNQIYVQLHTLTSEIEDFVSAFKAGNLPNDLWINFAEKIFYYHSKINEIWQTATLWKNIANSSDLETEIERSSALIQNYFIKFRQNPSTYEIFLELKKQSEKSSPTLNKLIDFNLFLFRANGVHLTSEAKDSLLKVKLSLKKLENNFLENVYKSSNVELRIDRYFSNSVLAINDGTFKVRFDGERNLFLKLDNHSYHILIRNCPDRNIRQDAYNLYNTRCSSKFGHDPKYDNSEIIVNIVNSRLRLANLLGFKSYSDMVLSQNIFKSSDECLHFLEVIYDGIKQQVKQDILDLQFFASRSQAENVEPWDMPYYSKQMKNLKISGFQNIEFEIKSVIRCMLNLAEKLFNITIKTSEKRLESPWAENASAHEVTSDNIAIGEIIFDLYSRENKLDGCWMSKIRSGRFIQGTTPSAAIICNFQQSSDSICYISHEEMVTLFHEFGHALHHVLSIVIYPDISGVNCVPVDAIEIPSNFMEQFCWEEEVLKEIMQTAKPNPINSKEFLNVARMAKNFQAALLLSRQLEFSLFDLQLHTRCEPVTQENVTSILEAVRKKLDINYIPRYLCYQNTFTHLFSDGYASKYYGYLFSEVCANEIYSNIYNPTFSDPCVQKFLKHFLLIGGSKELLPEIEEIVGGSISGKSYINSIC